MSVFNDKQWLQVQIIETERMLDMVKDHPLMSLSSQSRLKSLKQQLSELPDKTFEPKMQILFSGGAVSGSQGIRASFLSKAIDPIQELIKSHFSQVRFEKEKGTSKNNPRENTDLFLTALPTGSFGIELSQLEGKDLLAEHDISEAMKNVISMIEKAAIDDDNFESLLENESPKNISHLRKLVTALKEEDSILKIESNEVGIDLSRDMVFGAYNRISSTFNSDEELVFDGTLRGILLDSGRFEMQDNQGKKISGTINCEISEEDLLKYDHLFLNQQCKITLKKYTSKFKSSKEKIKYELISISEFV